MTQGEGGRRGEGKAGIAAACSETGGSGIRPA